MDNLLLLTDSYKLSHHVQYPPGTEHIYSYFESRGGEYPETVFFGLQYFLKKYLEGQVVTQEKIDEAAEVAASHLGNPHIFNRAGWEYILQKYDGRLPVRIRAVPEGTVVPTGNILMSVENTDSNCAWLTNYIETLLVQVWYPTTVATVSREMKKTISSYLQMTSDKPVSSEIDFKLHDFGFRGVSSVESAAIGGAAHLINFLGSDNLAAHMMLRKSYGEDCASYSLPASEHSTITSWGEAHEVDAFENMLDQYPTGLVACVSDSWDIMHAAKHLWGRALKQKILNRDGTLVIRPDSGEPTVVVPELLEVLGQEFGTFTNSKGYRVLPKQIRVIQGDGITRHSLEGILEATKKAHWSTENASLGSGGGLLQQMNRDTQKFVFKCSSAVVEGEFRDVYKNPVGAAWKTSKKGRLSLVYDPVLTTGHGSPYLTIKEEDLLDTQTDLLQNVFIEGHLFVDDTLKAIRSRAS